MCYTALDPLRVLKREVCDPELHTQALLHSFRPVEGTETGAIVYTRAMDTLKAILKKATTAGYTFADYTIYVGEVPHQRGEPRYELSICQGAMPPYLYQSFASLDEVEAWLDKSFGYTRESRVWRASEEED